MKKLLALLLVAGLLGLTTGCPSPSTTGPASRPVPKPGPGPGPDIKDQQHKPTPSDKPVTPERPSTPDKDKNKIDKDK
jgi:hypothetical protein